MGDIEHDEKASNQWRTLPGKEGVLYREHATRKNGRVADRCLSIRYRMGNGKRVHESLGWTSEGWTVAKAVALLRELKENIRTGQRPQTLKEKRAMNETERLEAERLATRVRLKRVTFGELAALYQQWADDNRVHGNIVRQLLETHILSVLGARVASEITTADVEELRKIVSAKRPLSGRNKHTQGACLAPQTVLHIIKTVREVFNFAMETPAPHSPGTMLFEGTNPAILSRRGRSLRMPKNDSRRLRILNTKEIAALLAYNCRYASVSDELHDMILFSLDTGVRAGELVHILRESCDPETGTVRIYKGSANNVSTKGGTSRLVHVGQLFPEARPMLRKRLLHSSGTFLFPGKDGGVRNSVALGRAMNRIMQKLKFNEGVTDPRNMVVWHTLRHTFATLMLESGMDIYTLKELMGHASVTTTEIYLHVCDRSKREMALARISLGKER